MKLKKTVFKNCLLKEVDFTTADLQEASFEQSDLEGAQFNGADLRKADFRGAHSCFFDLQEVKIKGAKMDAIEAVNLLRTLGIEIE